MKKIISLIICCLLLTSMTACAFQTQLPSFEPDEKQIRNICELATLKCYYHNVAKLHKDKGEGASHWFEKERDYWLEYTGSAKVGIDMAQVSITTEGNNVTVKIPKAKVINVQVENTTLSEESYYISEDGIINKNPITPEDQSELIKKAQEEMKATAESNTALLLNAQDRAKELIETYIRKLAETAGKSYNITWIEIEDADNSANNNQ